MKKHLLKYIRQRTSKFPIVHDVEHSTTLYTGTELLLSGKKTDSAGKPINPDKIYKLRTPTYREVNHFNKIKDLVKKTPNAQVENICEQYEASLNQYNEQD